MRNYIASVWSLLRCTNIFHLLYFLASARNVSKKACKRQKRVNTCFYFLLPLKRIRVILRTFTVVSPVYSISSHRALLRTYLVSSLSAVDRYPVSAKERGVIVVLHERDRTKDDWRTDDCETICHCYEFSKHGNDPEGIKTVIKSQSHGSVA